MTRFAMLALPIFASALAAAAPDDLPDRPGAVRVERRDLSREKRARDALPDLAVKVSGSGRFVQRHGSTAFAFNHAPGSVLGRLDLERLASRDGDSTGTLAMRVYLHGQGEEKCALEPGVYRLRAAFWITGQSPPAPFPHPSIFTLKRGQTGALALDRDAMRAIKKWLQERGK